MEREERNYQKKSGLADLHEGGESLGWAEHKYTQN